MDDIHALDGPRFLRMAWRIAAYEGVLAARIRQYAEPGQSGSAGETEADFNAVAVTHPDLFERRRV